LPPYVPYIMAFILWLSLACLVWLVAVLLSAARRTRPLAWPLSVAMAATFPGVWLFQIVAAPFAVTVLLLAGAVWWTLEPNLPETTESPFVIGAFIAAVLVDFVLVLGMSIVGFYEGWRTGWFCAKGRPWREVIGEGPTARLIHSMKKRRKDRIQQNRPQRH
jgi:hypothetical protein